MGYHGKEVCSARRETVMVVLLIISSNSLIFGAFGQEGDDPCLISSYSWQDLNIFPRCQGMKWQREEMSCVDMPEQKRPIFCFWDCLWGLQEWRVALNRVSLGIRRHDVSQRPEKPIVTAIFRAYLAGWCCYILHEMQCAHFLKKNNYNRCCLLLTQ